MPDMQVTEGLRQQGPVILQQVGEAELLAGRTGGQGDFPRIPMNFDRLRNCIVERWLTRRQRRAILRPPFRHMLEIHRGACRQFFEIDIPAGMKSIFFRILCGVIGKSRECCVPRKVDAVDAPVAPHGQRRGDDGKAVAHSVVGQAENVGIIAAFDPQRWRRDERAELDVDGRIFRLRPSARDIGARRHQLVLCAGGGRRELRCQDDEEQAGYPEVQ